MPRPSRFTGPISGCPIPHPHPRRSCLSCKAAYMRAARRAGRWTWSYNLKSKARSILNVYLRRGKILRLPCAVCANPKTQAHHDDYAFPLLVTWLCNKHHALLHPRPSPKL